MGKITARMHFRGQTKADSTLSQYSTSLDARYEGKEVNNDDDRRQIMNRTFPSETTSCWTIASDADASNWNS